jgi:undecaprenyl-diphosphatase
MAHVGDGQNVFGALGVIYLLSWLLDKPLLRQSVLTIALIVLVAMLVITLIKFGVRRQRPRPPGEFVQLQYDKYSFPSGHAARLAALAVITAFLSPALGWFLGGVALMVAVARVAVGIHYVSDIVAGLVIGGLVSWGIITVFPLLPVIS